MAIKTPNDVAREYLDDVSKAALLLFRDAVKPIYGVTDRGDPEHIGSALLLDLAEGNFMLTAAHVIDWSRKTSLYLGDEDFALLEFEALITAAPNGNRDKDHGDFAIARLDAEMRTKLLGAKFITEAEISRSAASSEERTYTCLGYPNSKIRSNRSKAAKLRLLCCHIRALGDQHRSCRRLQRTIFTFLSITMANMHGMSPAKRSTQSPCTGVAVELSLT